MPDHRRPENILARKVYVRLQCGMCLPRMAKLHTVGFGLISCNIQQWWAAWDDTCFFCTLPSFLTSRILKFNRFSHCFNTSDKQIQRRNSLDTQVCLAFWGLWMPFLLTKAGQNSVQNGTTAAKAFKIFIKVQVWRNSIVWLLLEVCTELFIWETFVGFHRWKRWNPSSMGTAGNSFES